MNYQALARKYRPRCFDHVVGQKATIEALSNTLHSKKLHHAYLFSGTRGVGKTSLARLFAKCLNCQSAITATPCETCETCLAIRENRFLDLIEIDAASRTRVEDMHALLDNIQYKPTMGRYKVYLIDEVHMLSTHSFNALLKTLEEPPSHIIFILATTDLNRVPSTILSRCLQFHLKNLSIEDVTQQLAHILQKEKIDYEQTALENIAQVTAGSLRDALSLLEQVIMYDDITQVKLANVDAILGRISEEDEFKLIEAIYHQSRDQLTQILHKCSEYNIDYDYALASLLKLFHQIAIQQLGMTSKTNNQIEQLAQQIHAEQIQLYYEIALIGRRNLPLAPTPRLGFEMTVLRMFAFQPRTSTTTQSIPKDTIKLTTSGFSHTLSDSDRLDYNSNQNSEKTDHSAHNETQPVITPVSSSNENNTLDWAQLIEQLPLQGFLKSLAMHCQLMRYEANHIEVQLHPNQSVLYNKQREKTLHAILTKYFNKNITFTISIGSGDLITPAILEVQKLKDNQKDAQQSILQDQNVQVIIKQFDGTIVPHSTQLKAGETNE